MTTQKIQKPSLFACLNCKLPPTKETIKVQFIDKVALLLETSKYQLVSASVRSFLLPDEKNVGFVETEMLELVAYIKGVANPPVSTFWVKDQVPSARCRAANEDGTTTCTYCVKDNEGREIVVIEKLPNSGELPIEEDKPTQRRKISQTSCGAIAKSKCMQIEQDRSGMFICKLVGRGGKLTLVTDCHGEAIRNKTGRELIRRIQAVNPKIEVISNT